MDKQRISLHANGLELVGEVYIPRHLGEERYPGLCICHGIPGPVRRPDDRGYPRLAERFCSEGFVVLIFNFRGTGESQGNFDILGWARDLTAAIDYLALRNEVDRNRISVVGFSGGAAVAVYVTAHDPRISAIVTCACLAEFSAGLDPARIRAFIDQARYTGIIRDPGFPPSPEDWGQGFREISPIRWIDQIAGRPILIIHGDKDQVVAVDDAQALYQKAKKPKDILIIKGGEHRLRTNERAMNAAANWLKKVNGLD